MFIKCLTIYNFLLKIFAIFFTFIFLISRSSAQVCKKINSCKCIFPNGKVIDLTSLGNQNEARFKDVKPIKTENYTYYYNPCFSFKLGNAESDCSEGVAVCRKGFDGTYQNCGNEDTVEFRWIQGKNMSLYYHAGKRITNITLICSEDAYEPRLEVVGEVASVFYLYQMRLTTRCACPDLCHEDHLSAGSVLVIIFLTFVSLYLILGIVHSSLTRGAHGWELLPNYEFWADFPLLVRDGCVFVISGCKPETAYERI